MEIITFILKMSQRKEKQWGMVNKYGPRMKNKIKNDLSRAFSCDV